MDSNIHINFYSQGGGLIREIKLPMQKIELKVQGEGLMCEGGGRNCGILQYYYLIFKYNLRWDDSTERKALFREDFILSSRTHSGSNVKITIIKIITMGYTLVTRRE